jgi:thiosulfate/3-mercaptopyruvate sulfurtransferase
VHGKIACVTCHNGIDNADGSTDKEIKENAHSSDFIAKPSLAAKEKCASCHPDVVARAVNSTHEQGWGQKSMVTLRYGLGTGPEKFDQLPEEIKHGYKSNCQSCHGTCGECHITRPAAGGGGLAKGHKFTRTPDMRKNCTTCHVSRGGHAYFGEGIGTVPDVHLTKAGFTCMNCHSKNEIHGDGNYYDQRYKNQLKPECSDCHSNLKQSNDFHKTHIEDFNCQTCHSQDYNNCGSCHIGTSEGARYPAHLKFKIGMNPLPDIKPYKMVTLRQSLMARDSWDQYGVDVMPNFDVRPAYKYTTPHNIIRWTARTDTSAIVIDKNSPHAPCSQACHILGENSTGVRINSQYYLFESDLTEDWQKSSTSQYAVDGKLPEWWNVN